MAPPDLDNMGIVVSRVAGQVVMPTLASRMAGSSGVFCFIL